MIRCYPLDGSGPFEVENETPCDACYLNEVRFVCWYPTTIGIQALGSNNVVLLGKREVRVESWRERAERLETELAALHSAALTAYGQTVALDQALDAIEKRRESEHG